MQETCKRSLQREPFIDELEGLLHPAQPYARPIDVVAVVADAELTLDEKRMILADWASACAIEGAPSLRRAPGSGWIVRVHEVLEALRTLDKEAGKNGSSSARRQVRRATIEAFRAGAAQTDTLVRRLS